MAFVSGVANDQDQLRTALVTVCAANGWTYTGSVLHKGNVFVRLWHRVDAGWANQLFAQLGKGMEVDGSAVSDPVGHSVAGGGPTLLQPAAYPVTYDIHVFDNEVFMVWWDNVDRHFWLAFGQSSPFTDSPAAGASLWLGGMVTEWSRLILGSGVVGSDDKTIYMTEEAGGSNAATWDQRTSPALFWWSTLPNSYQGLPTYPLAVSMTPTMYTDRAGLPFGGLTTLLEGVDSPAGTHCTPESLKPLIARTKNLTLGENKTLPIFGGNVTFNSVSPPGPRHAEIELRNARYFRLGANSPRDIIQVGRDRWKVYPWHKRNTSVPNGGNGVNHTGTFGWAIKYTGP